MQKLLIFYSFAPEDEKLQRRLEKHLSLLDQLGLISSWHHLNANPGSEWIEEVKAALHRADIILLLLSAYFISSYHSYSIEMQYALSRHQAGKARVIPVLLRPVYWEEAPFGKLMALPKNAKPVVNWRNRDDAFVEIALGVRQVVEELLRQKEGESAQQQSEVENVQQHQVQPEIQKKSAQRQMEEEGIRRILRKAREKIAIVLDDILPDSGSKLTDDDKDNIAFTLQEKLHGGEYKVVQGVFNKRADRVLGDREIERIDAGLSRIGYRSVKHRYYQEVVDLNTKIILTNPQNGYAYICRADAYKMLRDYNKALEDYDRAFSLGASSSDLLPSKARALFQLHRYEEAAQIYEEILRREPHDPYVWYSYGITLQKLDRVAEARTAFTQASHLQPSIAESYADDENALDDSEEDLAEETLVIYE